MPRRLVPVLLLVACAAPRHRAAVIPADDPYGGPPPGAPAIPFAPGAGPAGQTFSAAFTPDGRSLWFTRRDREAGVVEIMEMHRANGAWSAPRPAEFARGWRGFDPFVTRDGARLYFSWTKPRPGMRADSAADADTWVVERTAGGGWGAPRHVGAAPHTGEHDSYPGVTRDGTLYFDSFREAPLRKAFRARPAPGGGWLPSEPVPFAINGDSGASNLFIDPDERYAVFLGRSRTGYGAGDLHISFRTATGWTPARNLGPLVNTAATEFCPYVTPDGRWLFFTRVVPTPGAPAGVAERNVWVVRFDGLRDSLQREP